MSKLVQSVYTLYIVHMGKQLSVPWPDIQATYAQGVSAKDISDKYGVKVSTIYRRAHRLGWTKLRELSREMVQKGASKSLEAGLTAESNHWISEMRSIYATAIKELKSKQKAGKLTLRDLKTLAEITELTDKGGRRNLGLDKQEHTSNTFITIIESSDLVKSARLQGVDGEHVIDVEPVDD